MKNTELKIEYIDPYKLNPYKNNARKHEDDDVATIVASIKEFGMNDPIGIWSKDNIIVEGHGRLKACMELGLKEVPCIRLDSLTDEQRRAYTLAHNKTAEMSSWDMDLLDLELDGILDIDMEEFGFDLSLPESPAEKQNERERTMNTYNLDEFDEYSTEGYYQMPTLNGIDFIPSDLIGFNYVLNKGEKDAGVHFYIDDYQFERIWTQPETYIDKLREYECVLTPDFSLYRDMPMAMKIWNVYRSRLIGQICQRHGLKVIPTVSWCEKETFEWCFDGLPHNSTLSVSTIGVKKDETGYQYWCDGMDAMIEKLNPKRILVYGGAVDYDYKDIDVVYFNNHVTENMRNAEN